MTDAHRCIGRRGRIYNKVGWEEERVQRDFLEDAVPAESPEVEERVE